MFPGSYFPGFYFPPTYMPQVGPPAPIGNIRILINGVECTDRIFYQASSSWNLIRGSRGTCTLSLKVEPDELFGPQVGESIQIYDPAADRVWYGFIQGIGVRWLGDAGWHVITLTGVSLESLFDSVDLEKVKYAGVTCGAAFTDLHTRSEVTLIGLGTISDGPDVESLEVTNVAQGFTTLAVLAGFVWYVDPLDAQVYFHLPGARDAEWTVGSTDVLWETLDWNQNRADVRTEQLIQLPGVSMQPVIEEFDGDDVTTSFTLDIIPQYVVSISASIGMFARTPGWVPGTDVVTVTPPLPTGSTLTVRYSDTGLITEDVPATPVGVRKATYTKTRTFTPDGAEQERDALLAVYSMLPATLTLSTYKPGIYLARKLPIDLEYPLSAGSLLNGNWLVKEIEGSIVPGMDQLPEPFGHFRYTAHLINTAATAVFQGDGTTTDFVLPVIPESIQSFRTNADGAVGTWTPDTVNFSIVPALEEGESAAVDYVPLDWAPDVPSFVNTWEDIAAPGGAIDPVVLSSEPPGTVPGEEIAQQAFLRTLTLYNLEIGDDIAPHTHVYNDGTGYRLLGVLRKEITEDLTVRINKGVQFDFEELITVTIPSSAAIDETFEWPLAEGSPPILVAFFDKEILTADIIASDESTDANGVVQFTVEWTKNPLSLEEE